MFVSEAAELTFGTLDAQAIAQPAAKKLPDHHDANSRSGRDPRDQLKTAGIASRRRRNK